MLDYLSGLERAHHAHLKDGDVAAAARCTWWIGHHLLFRGRAGPDAGWFARGRRLLDSSGLDCVELGWLTLPETIKDLSRGRHAEAAATAAATAEIAERFDDQDLRALAVMEQGRALVGAGERERGVRSIHAVFDLADPTEICPTLEPFFTDLDANCELVPCMNQEELEAGMAKLFGRA